MSQGVLFEYFQDYEVTRKKLFCRLTDPERAEHSRDILSRPWMDLQICCYYDLAEDGLPDASIPIYKNCLSLWKIAAEKVLDDAWHNTIRKQEILFRPLDSVLLELQGLSEWADEPEVINGSLLYLLTNKDRAYGAIYMAMPDVLKQIGRELGKDFYILPSSIHECLILPDTDLMDEEGLNSLVRMVNSDCVQEKDVLADHVYYYDRLLQHVRSC